jgi:hypothetical protein
MAYDRDLAELKAEHPADFARLMEAGMESEIEAARLMRRNNFFLGRRSGYDLIDWWTIGANGTLYLAICATDVGDGDLRDMNAKETRESQRDFTGFDFRAWVHDMRHPDEAYADGPRAGVDGVKEHFAADEAFTIDKLESELKNGGSAAFVQALKGSPIAGGFEVGGRTVSIRYAKEVTSDKGRTITLVLDTPVYFIGGGVPGAKPREGFDVAVVQLQMDPAGVGEGKMAVAAKVKPGPDAPEVEAYEGEPLKLVSVMRKIS